MRKLRDLSGKKVFTLYSSGNLLIAADCDKLWTYSVISTAIDNFTQPLPENKRKNNISRSFYEAVTLTPKPEEASEKK